MAPVPWLVFRDFNFELHMDEISDYTKGMHISTKSLEFRSCIEDIGLVVMKSFGTLYTWSNTRSTGFLAKKLDKFLVND